MYISHAKMVTFEEEETYWIIEEKEDGDIGEEYSTFEDAQADLSECEDGEYRIVECSRTIYFEEEDGLDNYDRDCL